MEIIKDIINTVINNFDFAYVIIVNIFTYILIKSIDTLNKEKDVPTWQKRIILFISIICISFMYYINGYDNNIKLLNSSILAPIAWSWLLKPICKKFNIDYKDVSKYLD